MVIELTYERGQLKIDSRVERFGYKWELCGEATEMVNDDFICRLLTGIEPAKAIDLPIERRVRRNEDEREARPYSSSTSSGYGGSLGSSRASTGPAIVPEKKPPRFLSSNTRHQAGRAEKVRRQKERGRKSAKK